MWHALLWMRERTLKSVSSSHKGYPPKSGLHIDLGQSMKRKDAKIAKRTRKILIF
jgi:hypothetical protein